MNKNTFWGFINNDIFVKYLTQYKMIQVKTNKVLILNLRP